MEAVTTLLLGPFTRLLLLQYGRDRKSSLYHGKYIKQNQPNGLLGH